MDFSNIVPGMTFEKEFVVEEGDTAAHFGNDRVPVFASPRMISWIEGTAIGTVAPFLPEGSTTVGAEINTTHIKPSALGSEIKATALLTAVEGRKLMFSVEASDGVGIIGKGTHVRFIVDTERFMAKLK